MKALQFRKSIPRYVLLKLLGPRFRQLYTSGLVPVALRDLPEPKLPTSRWVRIAPTLAGICGSDVATVCAKGSPYLAPLTSMPFVLGHELVGVISETGAEVDRVSVGDRVVLHPALGCVARGIDPLCDSCKLGRDALCSNVTRGDVSSGIQIGFCRDTGGGFSDSLVAHESQVYKVPVEIDDRAAVLIEPFACALHGAFRACGSTEQTALVIGCGSIGLLTIAALRATGWTGRIVAVAKYDHQRAHAIRLGADEMLNAGGSIEKRYRSWAETLGAQVLDPQLGKPTVIGGADVTLDCVASPSSIDDGLRFTKSGGVFVLVGMPGMGSGIDWTPMWFKELTVHAAYAYGPERFGGSLRETFDIAMELMKTLGPRLLELVGPPFELKDYRAAFHSAIRTSQSGVVKTIFALENGRI